MKNKLDFVLRHGESPYLIAEKEDIRYYVEYKKHKWKLQFHMKDVEKLGKFDTLYETLDAANEHYKTLLINLK